MTRMLSIQYVHRLTMSQKKYVQKNGDSTAAPIRAHAPR